MPRISRFVTAFGALVEAGAVWFAAGSAVLAGPAERWAVVYHDGPSSFDLAAYDTVVLDPDQHPPIGPITERGRSVLAYLSLTEIGRERRVFPALARAGVILDEHPIWTDASYLDFRHPEWTRTVLEELVPEALAAGFNGLFLDTLDDAEYLENLDPVRFGGMRRAAIELVHAIRHHYPGIILMVNRGYAVLPEIADQIDILLGESVLTTFDPETKTPRAASDDDVRWHLEVLRNARAHHPALQIFTLDYWDPADAEGVRRLYRTQRANGFVPYVATPMLDGLVKEPR